VKMHKSKPRVNTKRNFKNFSDQAFLHDLYFSDLDCGYRLSDLALIFFANV
jgi:hypothetical protein